jgi:hypothetical protein
MLRRTAGGGSGTGIGHRAYQRTTRAGHAQPRLAACVAVSGQRVQHRVGGEYWSCSSGKRHVREGRSGKFPDRRTKASTWRAVCVRAPLMPRSVGPHGREPRCRMGRGLSTPRRSPVQALRLPNRPAPRTCSQANLEGEVHDCTPLSDLPQRVPGTRRNPVAHRRGGRGDRCRRVGVRRAEPRLDRCCCRGPRRGGLG